MMQSGKSKRIVAMAAWVFLMSQAACETGSQESDKYVTYSTLTEKQREEIRDTLGPFTSNPYSPVNVMEVFSVIEREVLRLYPYSAVIGDFSLSNGALDMTETLPKSDGDGLFAEDGGYILFEESYNDGNGTITEGQSFQRAREFTKGRIEDFDYYDSKVTENALGGYRDQLMRVTIASELEYEEKEWHQQVGGTSVFVDGALVSALEKTSFDYQSHPSLQVELNPNSVYSRQEVVRERILDKQGWYEESFLDVQTQVGGFVTLYRPSDDGLDPNEEPVGESLTEVLENNVLERIFVSTTEEEFTPVFMETEGVEMNITVRTTTEETTRTDAGTGALFSGTTVTTVSRNISYTAREGFELEALLSGELEWRKDHVETTKTTVTDKRVYATESPALLTCEEGDCFPGYECRLGFGTKNRCLPVLGASNCGSNQVSYGLSEAGEEVCQNPVTGEGSVQVLRTTNDPVTKNDIGNWKSTEESYTSTFETNDIGQLEERRIETGVEWLTDRIEKDPQFDRVAFSHKGQVGEEVRKTTHLLGAELNGEQTTWDLWVSRGTHSVWDGVNLIVNGEHTLSQGSLNNESSADYLVTSDTQGAYTVELNEEGQKVSSEEWLFAILLDGYFIAEFGP